MDDLRPVGNVALMPVHRFHVYGGAVDSGLGRLAARWYMMHLDGSAAVTVRRETFSFAFQNSDVPARSGWFGLKAAAPKPKPIAFPAEDVAFLRSFSSGLNRIGLILPDRA